MMIFWWWFSRRRWKVRCVISQQYVLCLHIDNYVQFWMMMTTAVALQTILAQENIRGGTCCWEKSISCLRKFPMNPNQGYVKRIFQIQTQIEIFKHPQASGNIFMSFTPPENKSGNLSNQFKQHKIWTDHKMSLKNKKKKRTQFFEITEKSKCPIWIFQLWHFPPIFVISKVTCLVTLFDRKIQVFKNSPKLNIFGIFNELVSTQNVKNFLGDFQTLWTYHFVSVRKWHL